MVFQSGFPESHAVKAPSKNHLDFNPKYQFPSERATEVLIVITDDWSQFQVFTRLFPYNSLVRIAKCTNQRLITMNRGLDSNRELTDAIEILVFLLLRVLYITLSITIILGLLE